jgi:hypothetical protein
VAGAPLGGAGRLLRHLDGRAVGRGVAGYLVIAVPCGIVIATVKGNGASGHGSSPWTIAAVLVLLVAPVVGGALAGRARPEAPLAHGAAAGLAPAGVFLLLRTMVGLVAGSLTLAQLLSFLLFLQVFTGLGMLGGYLAARGGTR